MSQQFCAEKFSFQFSHSATATRAWARKAVEWFSYEIGADASHVSDMSVIMERPEGHQAWGTRETGDVGGPVL